MRLILVMLMMSLAVVITANAKDLDPWHPTEGEMRVLPPYCHAKMDAGENSPEYKAWESRIGPQFIHIHHYCAGQNFVNRYYKARAPQDRQFNLSSALNNFDYVIQRATPDYVLLPEMLVKRGQVYKLMGSNNEAVADFQQALSINPKMVTAYFALADYYAELNQKAEALAIIQEGLKHAPDSAGLKRRYQELGGK